MEESLATNCTCMLCLEVLKQPTTCVPCGHTYCQVGKLVEQSKGEGLLQDVPGSSC